eukprot:m.125662 g.125662  ORF g.125662 m.125662 type:complete len:183 (+) comp29144_c2_seq1:187-735(+)
MSFAIEYSDPFKWQSRIKQQHDQTCIYVWGANTRNMEVSDGHVLGGSGMASRKGPTLGIARPWYVGVPTTAKGLKRLGWCRGAKLTFADLRAAIDRAFDRVDKLLLTGYYTTVVIPSDTQSTRTSTPTDENSPDTGGLGKGVALRQNTTAEHEYIQKCIGLRIERLKSRATKVIRVERVTLV